MPIKQYLHLPILSFYLPLFLLVCAITPREAFAQKSGKQKMEQAVFSLINQHRKKIGLNELKMNSGISEIARTHSRNMATGITAFGHDGFNDRIEEIKTIIPTVHAEAENVAYGARSAAEVVQMWLNSPGHKKNIEGKYNLTGVGIVSDADGTLYFTQLFARKSNR
jgi:uncharacterized protein YkwD